MVSLNKALIRPYFRGGYVREGLVDQSWFPRHPVIHPGEQCFRYVFGVQIPNLRRWPWMSRDRRQYPVVSSILVVAMAMVKHVWSVNDYNHSSKIAITHSEIIQVCFFALCFFFSVMILVPQNRSTFWFVFVQSREWFPEMFKLTYRVHVWCIYLHLPYKSTKRIAKCVSPMDGMGNEVTLNQSCFVVPCCDFSGVFEGPELRIETVNRVQGGPNKQL